MHIRRGTVADGPAFIRLVEELARFEKLPPPTPEAAGRLIADAFAERPPFELWVADDGGTIIAYAVTFATYSTFLARPGLYLEDLFVHPEHRRRGIGSAILAHLREVAAQRRCGRFEWTVLDWNVDAQRLYRRIGAELLPQWLVARISLEAD